MKLKQRFVRTMWCLPLMFASVLSARDYSVADFGAVPNSDTDAGPAIQAAIEAAGKSPEDCMVFPAGSYLMETPVLVPEELHLIMKGEGDVTIRTGNNLKPLKLNGRHTPYFTAFQILGSKTDVDPFPKVIALKNLKFVDEGDAENRSAVFNAQCYIESLRIEGCEFQGYTTAGNFGKVYTTEGDHPGSDAHTMIKSLVCKGNTVVSDDKETSQVPKSFHFHCPANASITENNFWGKGGGYVFRINGGNFDTIPVPERGSHDIEFAYNTVRSDTHHHEYCQMTKSSNIKIHDNEAYASTKGAHNFMDLFNCRNVEFYNNKATGGGLCFFGHADIGGGKYSNKLIGSQNFHAWDNTITNPTHTCIFNLGGDGRVGGNRAGHDALIERTKVIVEPGFDASRVAFIYSFIFNDIELRDNDVRNIGRFIRTYFDRGYNIHDNYIENVPELVKLEKVPGDDWRTRKTHKFKDNELVGTSGTVSGFEKLTRK
ncbi:glycosyl hydrolase family 28-related protein [Coraliomargarita parva]|uniref:glycosyl hydrolase family 28-related protein n=1 Tax=Coraliomargarita parva TaxID=3014050 RepID=UPI0022B34D81|nr:glycosyl hydrolase family 28-related protein [Coraliomargarita parva]